MKHRTRIRLIHLVCVLPGAIALTVAAILFAADPAISRRLTIFGVGALGLVLFVLGILLRVLLRPTAVEVLDSLASELGWKKDPGSTL